MDEVAALRRTVRRCTAALVVALGVTTMAVGSLGSRFPGLLLAAAGLFYLAVSVIAVPAE